MTEFLHLPENSQYLNSVSNVVHLFLFSHHVTDAKTN